MAVAVAAIIMKYCAVPKRLPNISEMGYSVVMATAIRCSAHDGLLREAGNEIVGDITHSSINVTEMTAPRGE